jgi:hypothetical protein
VAACTVLYINEHTKFLHLITSSLAFPSTHHVPGAYTLAHDNYSPLTKSKVKGVKKFDDFVNLSGEVLYFYLNNPPNFSLFPGLHRFPGGKKFRF